MRQLYTSFGEKGKSDRLEIPPNALVRLLFTRPTFLGQDLCRFIARAGVLSPAPSTIPRSRRRGLSGRARECGPIVFLTPGVHHIEVVLARQVELMVSALEIRQ
jgi:hypothetical protein